MRRSLTSLNTSFVASSFKLLYGSATQCYESHFKPFFFLLYWVLCMAQQQQQQLRHHWPWDHAALNSFLTEKGPKMTLETKRAAQAAARADTFKPKLTHNFSSATWGWRSTDECLKRLGYQIPSVHHYSMRASSFRTTKQRGDNPPNFASQFYAHETLE